MSTTGRHISPRVKAAVFARDGHACVLCGWKRGDKTRLRRGSGSSGPMPYVAWDLELDHIHPVKHGGKGTTDNLRVLCTGCNGRKGARIGAE